MNKNKQKLVVSKSNPILEAKNEMTLQELRIFNIYLALINPNDENSKHVSIKLNDLCDLLEVELNELNMKKVAVNLKTFFINLYDFDKATKIKGAMKLRSMFDIVDVAPDKNGTWYLDIEAHRDILPYLFSIKEMGYLKYHLWNILKLKGAMQIRFYEIMKRGEELKNFEMSLIKLKSKLGLEDTETYKEYKFFKRDVLNRCTKEINDKTDIIVTFEEIRAKRKGRPVEAIHFTIKKNKKFKDIFKLNELDGNVELEINIQEIQEANISIPYNIPKDVYVDENFDLEFLKSKIASVYPEDEVKLLEIFGRANIRYDSKKAKSPFLYYLGIVKKILEEPLTPVKEKVEKPNTFHNFDQREYDYDELIQQINSTAN